MHMLLPRVHINRSISLYIDDKKQTGWTPKCEVANVNVAVIITKVHGHGRDSAIKPSAALEVPSDLQESTLVRHTARF